MSPLPRPKGSRYEREVARQFGGKRTPLSGASGGNDLTFDAGIWADWAFELKRRKLLPVFVTNALRQAELALGIGSPKRPALIMREDNGRSIFVAYSEDVRLWCESLAEIGSAHRLKPLARELRDVAAALEKMA